MLICLLISRRATDATAASSSARLQSLQIACYLLAGNATVIQPFYNSRREAVLYGTPRPRFSRTSINGSPWSPCALCRRASNLGRGYSSAGSIAITIRRRQTVVVEDETHSSRRGRGGFGPAQAKGRKACSRRKESRIRAWKEVGGKSRWWWPRWWEHLCIYAFIFPRSPRPRRAV